MPSEIERKFLVEGDGWRDGVTQVEHFRDGLIARSGPAKVRVRLAEGRAWLTVKGPRKGLTRAEFEYEIPTADAREMLDTLCGEATIEKVRHCIPQGGLVWSVDVYGPPLDGVVVAEVELNSEDEVVDLPEWAGREVTHDPAYRKEELVRRAGDAARAGKD
jgi:adenylate cyclase